MLTDILRGQLNYQGLIITDDMMMNGATLFAGSFAKAVTMAIEAGNDIIISSTTANLYDNLWVNNINRMENNVEFKARVKDAAYRVILAKLKHFNSENHAPLYPDENTIYEHIPDKEGQKFFLDQACRSISVYKKGSAFPFVPQAGEKVLVAGPFLSLYNEARRCYPEISTFHFSYELRRDESNFDEWNAARLTQVADGYDTILIVVYDKHTANIAKRLRYMDKKVIILSIMSPVHILKDFEWADTILCGYSYSNYSFAALLSALKGEFVPQGKIPLE